MPTVKQLTRIYYNPRAIGKKGKKGPVFKFACEEEPDIHYLMWYDPGMESFTEGQLEFKVTAENEFKGITQRSISNVRILVNPPAGTRSFFYRSKLHKLVKNK